MQYSTLEEAYPNFYPKKQGKKKDNVQFNFY